MSCYAFFKRWLPLSQLVKNFQKLNYPFTLNFYFRSLANDLGCFPFDLGPSRSKSAYLSINIIPLLVLLTSKEPIKRPPKLISALPELILKRCTT